MHNAPSEVSHGNQEGSEEGREKATQEEKALVLISSVPFLTELEDEAVDWSEYIESRYASRRR